MMARALTRPVPNAVWQRALTPPPRIAPATPPRGDRLFTGLLRWTVPLWMLGMLTVAQFVVLCRLTATRWPRDPLVRIVAHSWFAIAAAQAFAALLVGVREGTPLTGIAALFGFGVTGWIFAGLAIAAGAAHGLSSPRVVRATAWLGLMILLLAGVAVVGRLAGLPELYLSPAPLGMLLPHSTTVRFYTSAAVYIREETLGEVMTRLILFFPWATALGLGGLGIFFISTLERHQLWRLLGLAGGLTGVIFSWSRIAIATALAVGAVHGFLRASGRTRFAVILLAIAILALLPFFGVEPPLDLSAMRHSVDSARAGSSMARDLIYQKSWEGFLASPWIGHGWIGASVHPKEELPIGSHSTIYGLLYTGGLPTFTCFIVAMLATLAALAGRLYTLPSTADRARIHVALALVLCLAAFAPFEELFSLTLPCLFMFTWIGAALGCDPARSMPSAAVTTAATAPGDRALRFRSG
ncbi:MAG TPA: O-antigen ligase family protein [Acetobacteraceae bacterium]|nr:O-antigen ligase family protein [Acetobacteraceae bacterium]